MVDTPEPCTITYMGDRYLVYPIQVCVPTNNRVYPIPGKSCYWVLNEGVPGKSGYRVLAEYPIKVVTR